MQPIQVVVNAPGHTDKDAQAANRLGLAATVLGLLAVVMVFVPCCGGWLAIPFGVLALVFGFVGLLAAIADRRTGVLFPLAGMSLAIGAGVLYAVQTLVLVSAMFSHLVPSGTSTGGQPEKPSTPTESEAAPSEKERPTPNVPDLKDRLNALQKDIANTRHDLDAVSRAVLDDLRLRPQYQEVKKDLDYWTAEDQTTKASHRHAKEFATQQRRRFAAQIQRMETDALDSSPAVQRLKAKLAGFRKGFEDTRQQIARQEEQKPEHE